VKRRQEDGVDLNNPPATEEYVRINTLHVIATLEKLGDSLKKPRLVSHFAYFASLRDRDHFVAKAVTLGFKLTDEFQSDDPEAGHPYGVSVERVERVDSDSIDAASLALFRLAHEVNGAYDGWETTLEKGDG
jgi:regulator of RNase E activity RraB